MKHIKIQHENGGSLEVHVSQKDDFCFEIDNPWSGDSETGFGRTESIYLTREEAVRVRDFLNEMLG